MSIAHTDEYRRFIFKNTWFGYRTWCAGNRVHWNTGNSAPGYGDKLLNYIKR